MGVGTSLVLLLMILAYGRFGFYANCALVLNVLMILGVMAVMGTTLTLPGIAGFVLTIGAAVTLQELLEMFQSETAIALLDPRAARRVNVTNRSTIPKPATNE